MCTGAEVAVIAGTASQYAGQQQQQHDQQRVVQQRLDDARRTNQAAGDRVSEEVNKLKDSTAEGGKGDENILQNDFMEALRRSQLANGNSGSLSDAEAGNVSDQFRTDAATQRTANVTGNRAAATNLARLDAPFMQRLRESTSAGRARTDLSLIDQRGQGQDFLSRLRASLISPNAGLEAAGDVLTGYGNSASQRMLPVKKSGSLFSQLPNQTPNYGTVS